jgi:hypothetical protein
MLIIGMTGGSLSELIEIYVTLIMFPFSAAVNPLINTLTQKEYWMYWYSKSHRLRNVFNTETREL